MTRKQLHTCILPNSFVSFAGHVAMPGSSPQDLQRLLTSCAKLLRQSGGLFAAAGAWTCRGVDASTVTAASTGGAFGVDEATGPGGERS